MELMLQCVEKQHVANC